MSKPTTSAEFVANLFEEQATPLLRYLAARFGNVDEAKEVAQEAWLRMFRLDAPGGLDNPKAFLFQTASNLAIDRVRHEQVVQRYADGERYERDTEIDVERTVSDRQQLDIIQSALAELPLRCRQAFTMHRHGGLSYPEIAESLGVSTSMVEKYIIQALKHFRTRLAEADAAPSAARPQQSHRER